MKVDTAVCVYANGQQKSLAGATFSFSHRHKGYNVDNPEEWLKAHSRSLVVADAASLFTGRSVFRLPCLDVPAQLRR